MSHLIGFFQRVNRTFSACSCNDSACWWMVVGHGNPRIEATRASHIKAHGLLVWFYRNYRASISYRIVITVSLCSSSWRRGIGSVIRNIPDRTRIATSRRRTKHERHYDASHKKTVWQFDAIMAYCHVSHLSTSSGKCPSWGQNQFSNINDKRVQVKVVERAIRKQRGLNIARDHAKISTPEKLDSRAVCLLGWLECRQRNRPLSAWRIVIQIK